MKISEEKLDEILRLFERSYRSFSASTEPILEQQGIQRSHYRILYSIARHPGISVNELLVQLGVTKQALHAPFRQLVDKGYARSEASVQDGRVRNLYLTDEGNKLEKLLTGKQWEMIDKVFGSFDDNHQEIWIEIMKNFVETIG